MIALSLGSNLGDRHQNLKLAIDELNKHGKVTKVSSFHETEPWGVTDQPKFINACVLYETDLDPHELLKTVKSIEKKLGRVESYRWGPRLIDIDILIFDNQIINETELKIPHPHMQERDFVMKPLSEIM